MRGCLGDVCQSPRGPTALGRCREGGAAGTVEGVSGSEGRVSSTAVLGGSVGGHEEETTFRVLERGWNGENKDPRSWWDEAKSKKSLAKGSGELKLTSPSKPLGTRTHRSICRTSMARRGRA